MDNFGKKILSFRILNFNQCSKTAEMLMTLFFLVNMEIYKCYISHDIIVC